MTEKDLNLAQRVLNRIGFYFAMRPFPTTGGALTDGAGASRAEAFDHIHEANHWGSPESISGSGSERWRTAPYAHQMLELMRERGFQSMFDAPCGDLNWMAPALEHATFRYSGGDVSVHAVAAARRRRPDLDIVQFDICSDPFPDVSVWQCRDCLLHLSFADIWAAFRNFARSSVPYALISTNSARLLQNLDIETGNSRLLDLERPPFNLARPLHKIRDYPGFPEFPRFVGLWTREQIADAVRSAG